MQYASFRCLPAANSPAPKMGIVLVFWSQLMAFSLSDKTALGIKTAAIKEECATR
jgi:hypothetical protein